MYASESEKPQSWWKRHCTPPPAVNKSAMCPCTDCFNGDPHNASRAPPVPMVPSRERRQAAAAPATRPSLSPTSTNSSTSSSSSSTVTRNVLRKSLLRKEMPADLVPLFQEGHSTTSLHSQMPRQSDELSLAGYGSFAAREAV
ncbi:hypothetical protein VD0004_g5362 [Verticillium dahliae]|uniref:Uncharacterized protein n=1 Tax=Verticillium dahliae TaxID=27337 RepID=A0A444RKD7_VERDA|nr:hypothetical protein VD0004_g5362 [Verticillium dahliae]PNH72706.1 hypothetical protein VD0001_g4826 [Verticillium dahliae]RXG41681.1 hypothetical protein VDGE_30058 [Verticillium dahliae]